MRSSISCSHQTGTDARHARFANLPKSNIDTPTLGHSPLGIGCNIRLPEESSPAYSPNISPLDACKVTKDWISSVEVNASGVPSPPGVRPWASIAGGFFQPRAIPMKAEILHPNFG